MKRIFSIFIILMLFTSLSNVAMAETGSILEGKIKEKEEFTASKELEEKLLNQTVSIVMVDRGIGSCSGTIIGEHKGDHYVLTAKHCIDVTEEMYVEHNKVLFIITSVDDDLAIIVVDGKIPKKSIAVLADFESWRDDIVHHVAYPTGIIYKRSGRVTRITKDWHWFDFEAIGGCSGGGVFNEDGELVSVLWGGYSNFKEEQPIKSVGEPLSDIKRFLDTINGTQ